MNRYNAALVVLVLVLGVVMENKDNPWYRSLGNALGFGEGWGASTKEEAYPAIYNKPIKQMYGAGVLKPELLVDNNKDGSADVLDSQITEKKSPVPPPLPRSTGGGASVGGNSDYLKTLKAAMEAEAARKQKIMSQYKDSDKTYAANRSAIANSKYEKPKPDGWYSENKQWLVPLMGLAGTGIAGAIGGSKAAAGFGQGYQQGTSSSQARQDMLNQQAQAQFNRDRQAQLADADTQHKVKMSEIGAELGNNNLDDMFKLASLQQQQQQQQLRAQGSGGSGDNPTVELLAGDLLSQGLSDNAASAKLMARSMQLKYLKGIKDGTIKSSWEDWLADAKANYGTGMFSDDNIADASR